MASHSKKDNKQLEEEQKQIKYKPEDLMDTDAEAEFQEGDKKGFRQQTGKPANASSSGVGSKGKGNTPPSNEQLQKEQSQEKLKPEDLKDTDADDEFKEGGKPGFRKQTDKARL